MSEFLLDINRTGHLGKKDGAALRKAYNLDALDALGDTSYRFNVSPDVSGVDSAFFQALIGKSLGAFMKQFYADEQLPNKKQGAKYLRQRLHPNPIKGDAETAANLTSNFLHNLIGVIAAVEMNYSALKMTEARQKRRGIVMPDDVVMGQVRENLYALTRLDTYAL